jgi:hypothetical protein
MDDPASDSITRWGRPVSVCAILMRIRLDDTVRVSDVHARPWGTCSPTTVRTYSDHPVGARRRAAPMDVLTDLSEQSGVSCPTISRVERGTEHNATRATSGKLGAALGFSIAFRTTGQHS